MVNQQLQLTRLADSVHDERVQSALTHRDREFDCYGYRVQSTSKHSAPKLELRPVLAHLLSISRVLRAVQRPA
jgi:hypothetical protein